MIESSLNPFVQVFYSNKKDHAGNFLFFLGLNPFVQGLCQI